MTGRELIRRAGLAFLFFLAVGTAGFAQPDEADERLFRLQLKLAQGGDPNAQYYLGEMYEQGLGTEANLEEAFKWYAKAAEKGHPYAKRKLAMRKEIEAERERERRVLEALRAGSAAAEQKPAPPPAAAPPRAAKKQAPVQVAEKPAAPAAAAAAEERARLEEARRQAEAEREKKRQAVRRMLLEMQKEWKGEAFE